VAKARSDEDPHDEIARLLALQIRLSVGNQARAITELNKAGIRPSRIADLLGTSPGTVNVALQRSKKSKDGTDG
jgi:hypothetical protein